MTKVYFEVDEIQRLEDAANNLRDQLLIRLLFHLGCRISEALGLTPDDVDFANSIVRIQHLKSRISLNCKDCGTRLGKIHTFCPKCGAVVKDAASKAQEHRKMRTLPVDNKTLDRLKYFIKRGGPIKVGEKLLIFGISQHRAWQIVKEYAAEAGLPKLVNPETGKVHNVSPHKLRDAFAINAMKIEWRPLQLQCEL